MSEFLTCALCYKPTHTKHHLIFGVGKRNLADEDGLIIPLCDECHNMAIKPQDRIHGNSVAEKLSKMLGQSIWEQKAIASGKTESEARVEFVKRYGRNYL